MNVEIVAVGDELLLGFTVDTNGVFLSRQLAEIGYNVIRRTTCADRLDDIESVVRDAVARTGAVITTGGLGPTADDVTTEAVGRAFGRRIVRDDSIAEALEHRWRARGMTGSFPESNYTQAMIPEGAVVLQNDHGSAPGVLVEDEKGRWAATLPGVPREMREMFKSKLKPRLEPKSRGRIVRSRTLRTTGIGESSLADKLGELGSGIAGLSLAFLPGNEGVDLRLTARDMTAEDADRAMTFALNKLRDRIGPAVYGEDDTDLASVVIDLCRGEALRIAVAESCTGGLLGARVTAVPGSSDVFHGGIIAYDNRVKRQLLGVLDSDLDEHGAVSEPVALQMAKAVRVRFGTEVGIAITGIAGPGGATPGKPVGTVWVAIDVSEGRPPVPRPHGRPELEPYREARLFQFFGDREEIRARAAQGALSLIRRTVLALENQSGT